ncbi:MAG: hypothetical protein NVSMB57_02640 [Actinomycetota bacterium]
MVHAKTMKATWTVSCKACGKLFPAPLERQTLDELTDLNAYQCPECGQTEQYAKVDHHPAA